MHITQKILFFACMIPHSLWGDSFFESSKAFLRLPQKTTSNIISCLEPSSMVLFLKLYVQKSTHCLDIFFDTLEKLYKEEEKKRSNISNDEEFKRLCIAIKEEPEKNRVLFDCDTKARKTSRFLTEQNKMPEYSIQALKAEEEKRRKHLLTCEVSSREDILYQKKKASFLSLKTSCDNTDIYRELKRPKDSNYWKKPIKTSFSTAPLTKKSQTKDIPVSCKKETAPSYLSLCFFVLTKIFS